MKLIVIYGPPAVGKLTVGRELASLTGYKLFHNHLAIDLVHEVYDWDNAAFFSLVHTIRTAVIESAVKSETNLILTFFYTGTESEKTFFKRIEELAASPKNRLLFVRLTAPFEVLLERVENQSRREFRKLVTKDALAQKLKVDQGMLYDTTDQLMLDTVTMQPLEMAQAIKERVT